MIEISKRESELPKSSIARIMRIAEEEKGVISLGPGEPDFITPKPVLSYVKKMLDKTTHYSPTEGREELREMIAKKLKKENGIHADTENIVIAAGSQTALFLALTCTIDAGEEVIVPDPGYFSYASSVDLLNGIPVPLKFAEGECWQINPDRLKKIIEPGKTKVLIINTPNNPTGAVYSRKILEEVADIAVDKDLTIFSDEAYEKFIYGSAKHISIGSFNGMHDRVVTFQSFSKSYAMPGFRIGYACGPYNLIKAMVKAHVYVSLSAPNISQIAAEKALKLPAKYVEKMRKEYDKRRKFIVGRLKEIGMRTVVPEGAFYVFSALPKGNTDDRRFSSELLKKHRVVVVPGSEFGRCGEGYIRCSYATSMPKIRTAMNRIEKFIKK